jgi:hypothetical protein
LHLPWFLHLQAFRAFVRPQSLLLRLACLLQKVKRFHLKANAPFSRHRDRHLATI